MKKFLKIFLVAALVVSTLVVADARRRPKKAADTRLRLISYNIRMTTPKDTGLADWDARKFASVKMIRTEKPDVFGLQEPRWPQLDYLYAELPDYDHYAEDKEGGLKESQCEAIFWLRNKYELLDKGMYWLSATPEKVSKGWDGNRRITVWVHLKDRRSGRDFWYFCTHMDHRGMTARQKAAELNVEKMTEIAGDKAVVFLSGDMNSQRDSKTGKFLEPYDGWMDDARERAKKTDDHRTYGGFSETSRSLWLDYIFSRNATPLHYRTLDSPTAYGLAHISDHYPICCDYEF